MSDDITNAPEVNAEPQEKTLACPLCGEQITTRIHARDVHMRACAASRKADDLAKPSGESKTGDPEKDAAILTAEIMTNIRRKTAPDIAARTVLAEAPLAEKEKTAEALGLLQKGFQWRWGLTKDRKDNASREMELVVWRGQTFVVNEVELYQTPNDRMQAEYDVGARLSKNRLGEVMDVNKEQVPESGVT